MHVLFQFHYKNKHNNENVCFQKKGFIIIWMKGEVGAPLNRFKPSSKIFYWPFQGGTSFVDLSSWP